MEITGSIELHKHMWFWFVQEIAKEEGLLKFLCDRCDDLRRKNVRRYMSIRKMEDLGERGVAVDFLESLKQTHARETAKLAALTDAIAESVVRIIEKERHRSLKTPPSQTTTMKKTSTIVVIITACFYLLCGGSGYASFGDLTLGNLLIGFGFYEQYWLVDFGNACIVLHLVGGYQKYSQTLYAIAKRWYAEKFPESLLLTDIHNLKVLLLP
nr:probable amino acid permease 7 isoform X2 [Tanacetum cinerariifolium]